MKPPKMIDNKKNGSVAEELRLEIKKDTKLSVITAYFTIFAFAELKKELMKVKQIRFLFPIEYLFIDEAHKISKKDGRSAFYYKVVNMLSQRSTPHTHYFCVSEHPESRGQFAAHPGRCK